MPLQAYPELNTEKGDTESMLNVAINSAKHACAKKALQVLHDVALGVHDEAVSILLADNLGLEKKLAAHQQENDKTGEFLSAIDALVLSLDQALSSTENMARHSGPPALSLRQLAKTASDPMEPEKLAERADAWKKAQTARRRLVQFVTPGSKSDLVRNIERFIKNSKVRFGLNDKHVLYTLSLDCAGESCSTRTNPPWKLPGQTGKVEGAGRSDSI